MNFSADRMIDIGNIKVTLPALISAVAGIFGATFLMFKGQTDIAISLMFALFINAYTVNCAVTGHCNTWAWFLTILFFINIVMIFSLKKFVIKK